MLATLSLTTLNDNYTEVAKKIHSILLLGDGTFLMKLFNTYFKTIVLVTLNTVHNNCSPINLIHCHFLSIYPVHPS